MLDADEDTLRRRAETIASRGGKAAVIERGKARPGGGSLPLTLLEGPVCAIDPGPIGANAFASRLRAADPPVIARVESGMVILDTRTL